MFTKLGLRSGYNLIRIRRDDEWKTAFITPSGHYGYQVMPYVLSNSPSIFQGLMNEVFREFLHNSVIHRRHPDTLPEPGRPSPSRYAGLSETTGTPTRLEISISSTSTTNILLYSLLDAIRTKHKTTI